MSEKDPQKILNKFHQMGILLLLDCPQHLQFGIDNISWKVGNKFKGIKLIPLGTHIITYSLKNENYMFPIKQFIYFGPSTEKNRDDERIRVYRWSSKIERFVTLKGEQAEGYREGVKKYHFDSYLGPYPDENIQFWSFNTKYISKSVLDRLNPIQYYEDYREEYIKNKQVPVEQANFDSGSDQQQQAADLSEFAKNVENLDINQNNEQMQNEDSKRPQGNENIQQVKKNKDFGGNIYYSDIPRRLTQSITQTTQINMDRTAILDTILKTNWPKNQYGMLGEIQYSFIAFLIGQCLDSYNQWKKLTILMSSSEKAFNTHKQLMLQFIVVFYQQLRQFPQDFFIDQLAKDNFLTTCLQKLNFYKQEQSFNKKARSRIQKLLMLVKNRFGFEPAEEQEDAPLIVEQNSSYF